MIGRTNAISIVEEAPSGIVRNVKIEKAINNSRDSNLPVLTVKLQNNEGYVEINSGDNPIYVRKTPDLLTYTNVGTIGPESGPIYYFFGDILYWEKANKYIVVIPGYYYSSWSHTVFSTTDFVNYTQLTKIYLNQQVKIGLCIVGDIFYYISDTEKSSISGFDLLKGTITKVADFTNQIGFNYSVPSSGPVLFAQGSSGFVTFDFSTLTSVKKTFTFDNLNFSQVQPKEVYSDKTHRIEVNSFRDYGLTSWKNLLLLKLIPKEEGKNWFGMILIDQDLNVVKILSETCSYQRNYNTYLRFIDNENTGYSSDTTQGILNLYTNCLKTVMTENKPRGFNFILTSNKNARYVDNEFISYKDIRIDLRG